MIIIDGKECGRKISEFSNLEELLSAAMAEDAMQNRIVTDVLINDENFSEIYPHQAEDMDCSDIEKVEIRTRQAENMAVDASGELEKAGKMMEQGAKTIASLLREDRQTDALEMFQDLLDVTRDFMSLLAHLRDRFLGGADQEFIRKTEDFSNLITELSQVLENGDWILLADMLEYEFAPACVAWQEAGKKIHAQLEKAYK